MGLKLLEIRNFGLKTSRTENIRLKMPKIGNVYLKMPKTGNIGLKMLFFRIWEHWLEIPGNREHWPKKRREQGTLTPPIRASLTIMILARITQDRFDNLIFIVVLT